MYDFEKVRGSVRPKEIDTDSSQYYTYIRKDIKKVQEEDPPFDGWEYLECRVPNDEWAVEAIKAVQESNNALMLGLVDLYEIQIGEQ